MNRQHNIFITVQELLKHIGKTIKFEIVGGRKGLKNQISSYHILEPDYLVSNLREKPQNGEVLLLSERYIKIFENFSPVKKIKLLKKIFLEEISCVFLVQKDEPHKKFISMANYHKIPVIIIQSPLKETIETISLYLTKTLSQHQRIHGVMMDILGVGVLILGDSGIGKSENALDLVMRGHRLISDDIVDLYESLNGEIIATSPELTKYHMEIRGLGIINIKELFGISATGDNKKIQLIIELEIWDEKKEYDRLIWSMKTKKIMDKEFPIIRIPVAPGRNLSAIIEVAVRVFLLRQMGVNPIIDIDKRLREWNINNGE
jgi:HPr kinase/phosphorylase